MVDRGLCVRGWLPGDPWNGWGGHLALHLSAFCDWSPVCSNLHNDVFCPYRVSLPKMSILAKVDHGWMWQRAWPEAWPYSRSWKAVLVSGLRATRSGPLRPLWALVSPAGVEGVGTGRQKEGTPILSGAASIQTSNDGAPFCQVGAGIGGSVLRSQCYWSHHVKNRFLAKIR